MLFETYKTKLHEAKEVYYSEVHDLNRDYALANNTIKVGDIVTDHVSSILVEKINIANGSQDHRPYCVYLGAMLTKTGGVFKNGRKRQIHQSNLGTK